MITKADEHLARARDHIAMAIIDLSAIVIEDCPGSGCDNFSFEFKEKIERAFDLLRMAKKKLAV